MEKSIVKIKLREGRFASYEGTNVEKFEDDLAIIDGWRCKIYPDGALKCSIFLRKDISPEDKAVLKIGKAGQYKFSIIENGVEHYIKCCKVDRWPDNGTIILMVRPNGQIYASFKNQEYEEFLRIHGVNYIKRENPNKLYTLLEHKKVYDCFTKTYISKTIQTDGIIEQQDNISIVSYKDGYYEQRNFRDVIVKDATWVIETTYDTSYKKPLHTLHAIRRREKLEGLPIIADMS